MQSRVAASGAFSLSTALFKNSLERSTRLHSILLRSEMGPFSRQSGRVLPGLCGINHSNVKLRRVSRAYILTSPIHQLADCFRILRHPAESIASVTAVRNFPEAGFWIVERERSQLSEGLYGARAKKSKPFGCADRNNGNGVSAKPITFFFPSAQTRSKRSRFITLFQAPTKSWTNFPCESEHA